MRTISPKSLILELLSVADGNSVAAKELVQVGELLGFKPATVRVALARLLKDLLIESDERGHYRVNPEDNPISKWVARWRLGARRKKTWDHRWIAAYPLTSAGSPKRHFDRRALDLMGFREGFPELWVRPNNLRITLDNIKETLRGLGLTNACELFIANEFDEMLTARWKLNLWQPNVLDKKYAQLAERLSKSKKKCLRMPVEKAVVETFVLGGEVIRELARDPLLPEEIQPNSDLQSLTELMSEYDTLGRQLMAHYIPQIS